MNSMKGMAGLFIVLLVLSSCSNPSSSDVKTTLNLTGNWKAKNTVVTSTNPDVIPVGQITTATFTIYDNNGSITISNFSLGDSYMIWNEGYGTYNGNTFIGSITGYYYNVYNQIVSVAVTFNGTLTATTGNGTFNQTFTLNGSTITCTGTTLFSKI